MYEALFYKKLNNNKVSCRLCHHFCLINASDFGLCQIRKNLKGILYSLNFGKLIAQHIDPIEKKPLFHFLPGTHTYSLACVGCNFKCLNCQNADISQSNPALINISDSCPETKPEKVIEAAKDNNCPSISYTYTEPTVFVEFALDCMRLARENNLKNIWVSNGFMSAECLKAIIPFLDAINVDLKFFQEKNYQKVCDAKLQPILKNLITLKKSAVHLEITTLIIPSLNESQEELSAIAKFIYQKLGADTPWHVSAFFPTHELKNLPNTPVATVLQARDLGEQIGLKYVYAGNI